jgi:hypothetical protein
MLPFVVPLNAFRLPVLPGLLDACLCEQAWLFCRGVLEFLSKAKGEWQLLARANSFSSFYCCELTHSFSSSSVTTILDNDSRQKEGRKEVSCLSAGGDNSLQHLTNLEDEPGVAAAVAGGEGLELATHRQPR